MQCLNGVRGIRTNGIADRNDAEYITRFAIVRLIADDDNRLRLRFDVAEKFFQLRTAHAEFVRETVIANEINVAVNAAFRAAPCLMVFRVWE